jgi:hypothetical protein
VRLGAKASQPLSNTLPFERILALIAQEAQITLYAELFPRFPILLSDLPSLEGTPEELLTHVCARAGYRWRKVGEDYLVYSKSWAQDRYANVPQSLIERLISSQAQHKRLVLADLMEIAALKKEQVATLSLAFPGAALMPPSIQGCLRLLKSLPASEVSRAYRSPDFNITFSNGVAADLARAELGSKSIPLFRIAIQRNPVRSFAIGGGRTVEIHSFSVLLRDNSGLSRRYEVVEPLLFPPK